MNIVHDAAEKSPLKQRQNPMDTAGGELPTDRVNVAKCSPQL